jgi:hypothetical protein
MLSTPVLYIQKEAAFEVSDYSDTIPLRPPIEREGGGFKSQQGSAHAGYRESAPSFQAPFFGKNSTDPPTPLDFLKGEKWY